MKAKRFLIFLMMMAVSASFCLANGATIYKKCAGCHGKDGKTKAFGKSGIISGYSQQEIYDMLMVYKDGEFKVHGVAKVMAKQVKKLSLEELKNVSEHVSKLKN